MYRVIGLTTWGKRVGQYLTPAKKGGYDKKFCFLSLFLPTSPPAPLSEQWRIISYFFSKVQDITPITQKYLLDKLRWF
jgi:hypothetical protein